MPMNSHLNLSMFDNVSNIQRNNSTNSLQNKIMIAEGGVNTNTPNDYDILYTINQNNQKEKNGSFLGFRP